LNYEFGNRRDRLRDGAPLVLPLSVPLYANLGQGAMVKIKPRVARSPLKSSLFVAIYSCTTMHDSQLESMLLKALTTRMSMKVKPVG
jgi:hypothetical protein